MTAVQLTVFRLDCDGCGVHPEADDYIPYYHVDHLAAGRKEAAEQDWWHDGINVDLCHSCKTEPHAAALDPMAPYFCTRCNEPVDEHDAADPVVPVIAKPSGPDLFEATESNPKETTP